MAKINDIDEGTLRRVDWLELVPPTLFFRAFSTTFKFGFIALSAILLAACFPRIGEIASASFGFCEIGRAACASCEPIPKTTESCSAESIATIARVVVAIAVFCFMALAISRTSGVALTSTSRSSIIASFGYAVKRFRSLATPIVIFTLLFLALVALIKATRAIGCVGSALAPIVIIALVVLLFALIVVALAFPLVVSAIAIENCDGFDALSRGVSYLTQRPAFCVLYVLFASLALFVGVLFVGFFTRCSITIYDQIYADRSDALLVFWKTALAATPAAYAFVASVVYSNAIYVLLRRSVDGTPYDSCALDLSDEKPRRLRKILQDAKGAPEFDAPKESETKTDESN